MKILSAGFLLFLLVGSVLAQTSSGRGTISGRVTHNGKGVKGVAVSLCLETSSSHSNVPQILETNLEGEYKFEALSDGSYNLEIASTNQYALPSVTTNLNRRWQTVVIENGSTVSGIDFPLALGAIITGIVKDAKGKPLIEAHINLMAVDEKGNVTQSYIALANQSDRQTDDRGVYRIYGIPAGRYIISARPRQAKGEQANVFHPSAKEAAKATAVELSEGIEQAEIDIIFSPAEKGYTLSGRVIEAESEHPIANTTVRYIKYEMVTSGDNSYAKHLSSDLVPTDVEGKFVFKGVVAGQYSIFADPLTEPKYSEPLQLEVTHTDVQDLELTLIKGATIRGRVMIEGSSKATDFSKIKLSALMINRPIQRINRTMQARIQSDGSYVIEGLISGDAHLLISGSTNNLALLRIERNGVVLEKYPTVTGGETLTDVNVILATGNGSVKGQVVFEGKKPEGICFSIVAERIGRPSGNIGYNGNVAEVDVQGRFVFDRLPPGEYELVADPEYIFHCGSTVQPKFPTVQARIRVADKSEQRVTMVIKLDNQ